jgi:hypothetical protein
MTESNNNTRNTRNIRITRTNTATTNNNTKFGKRSKKACDENDKDFEKTVSFVSSWITTRKLLIVGPAEEAEVVGIDTSSYCCNAIDDGSNVSTSYLLSSPISSNQSPHRICFCLRF